MIREGIISDYISWIRNNSDRKDLLPINVLKTISGGRSGAQIYLVEYGKKRLLGVLKINERDEVTSCQAALKIAAQNNVEEFIANIIHSCKIENSEITEYVVLYELAGDDICPRMLNDLVEDEDVVEQATLNNIVKFLFEWKKGDETLEELTPIEMIKNELGSKYFDDKFKEAYDNVGVTKSWFLINKKSIFLPNPCLILQDETKWEDKTKPFDLSISHNDFHGGNVILRGKDPVIIDFADYKRNSNIFYDLMYLEFHLLFDYYQPNSENKLSEWIQFCDALSKNVYDITMPKCKGVSIFRGIMPILRNAIKEKFDPRNTYCHIMLWTAAISVGLNVMRRSSNEFQRKASFIYAAYYLKSLLEHKEINLYEPDLLDCQVLKIESEKQKDITHVQSSRDLKFKYKFIPYGSRVLESSAIEENLIKDNRIFLDVGCAVTKGAIDLHDSNGGLKGLEFSYESTMALVALMPDLITENVSPDTKEVEICVHIYPDFDCFASVYTTQYLLTYGKLPNYVDKLVQYTESVDKGLMVVNNGCLNVPFTIANVISEVISNANPADSDDIIYEKTLIRGIELIDFCMKRLDKIKQGDISLNNFAIMSGTKVFDKEYDLIRNDYSKYIKEIEEGYVKRYEVSLPQKWNKAVKSIYGLIWDKPSLTFLHKYWARSDFNSPDCKGYTFTFIPLYESERVHKVFGRIPIARVIISVKPDSDVTLRGLGKLLEEAEVEKEEQLFNEKKSFWRRRDEVRYQEHWCDNANPWYDGRNHGFTIVDSPSGGSLLTIEEIKEVVLKYNDGKVILENI